MTITIQLSGISRELAKKEEMALEITQPGTFILDLEKAIPELKNYYYKVSINGNVTDNYISLNANDKVLIFSPLAGG